MIPLRARLNTACLYVKGWLQFWWYLPRNVHGMRRDQQALIQAYEQLARQSLQETQLLNNALERLRLYEQNIPRMRDLRQEFDLIQSGLKKPNGKIELLHP